MDFGTGIKLVGIELAGCPRGEVHPPSRAFVLPPGVITSSSHSFKTRRATPILMIMMMFQSESEESEGGKGPQGHYCQPNGSQAEAPEHHDN